MKNRITLLLTVAALIIPLRAEDQIPLIRPDEQRAIESQRIALEKTLAPVIQQAAKSTVRIWAGKKRIAYGTVVADGKQVLSKWSEIVMADSTLRIQSGDGALLPAEVVGVYREEDLALLKFQGSPLPPATWDKDPLDLGQFLVAPQPNGRLAAFGVVSVLERNLRETNQAFLGIGADRDFDGPGVRIQTIKPESPAALAGLKEGDVILEINQRKVSGLLELKNALTVVTPGQKIQMRAIVNKKESELHVELAQRPETPQFSNMRLQQMERMGGAISAVRSNFSDVVQSDMRPSPNQIGGPVTNLDGEIVGITMARADRTRSFVMPAAAVTKLLEKSPIEPALALEQERANHQQAVQTMSPPMGRPARGMQTTEERMMRHLGEMQRLMDHMEKELQSLDYGEGER